MGGRPGLDLGPGPNGATAAAPIPTPGAEPLTAGTAAFYAAMLLVLEDAGVEALVGGAYAFARYTGIERHTKDFDVFVRPADADRALAALAAAGCAAGLTFPHWLGKAACGDDFIDVIFSSGNGLAAVDDEWYAFAVADEVLGLPVRLIPAEEMLWSKAFVMERERFDGADVNHLLRARAGDLDWGRVLRRFGEHWRVLLAHLVLFGYVYPAEARALPTWVMDDLLGRLQTERDAPAPTEPAFRGPVISREQYLIDLTAWGYPDPRLEANGGPMSPAEVREWTDAIGRIP